MDLTKIESLMSLARKMGAVVVKTPDVEFSLGPVPHVASSPDDPMQPPIAPGMCACGCRRGNHTNGQCWEGHGRMECHPELRKTAAREETKAKEKKAGK